MPTLRNPRHEAFAQALARGTPASAAYGQVGFKPHRANAATLARKEHILEKGVAALVSGASLEWNAAVFE